MIEANTNGQVQRLVIKEKFPSLNEVIDIARSDRYRSNDLKSTYTGIVVWECRAQRIKPVKCADFTFIWTEQNKRRNKDNIASAKKFILDGLQAAGVIENDGWKQINTLRDEFRVGSGYSVEVVISEAY